MRYSRDDVVSQVGFEDHEDDDVLTQRDPEERHESVSFGRSRSLTVDEPFDLPEELEDSVERRRLASLLLPRRGLLVFSHAAYEQHLHTVPALAADDFTQPDIERLDGAAADAATSLVQRRRRLSLTVRHVLHTLGAPEQAGGASVAVPPIVKES